MTKRYCWRGHDTLVVGRTQRMCRECRRISDRARYARSERRRAQVVNNNALQRVRRRIAATRDQILELLLGRENRP
jgi:hypothetical protein